MNMRSSHFGLLFLLALGIADAGAGVTHGEGFFFRLRNAALEQREDPRREQTVPQTTPQPRNKSFDVPDTSGSGAQPDNNVQEYQPRPGRLTPEERRALRRQIDEAGHDIYLPPKR